MIGSVMNAAIVSASSNSIVSSMSASAASSAACPSAAPRADPMRPAIANGRVDVDEARARTARRVRATPDRRTPRGRGPLSRGSPVMREHLEAPAATRLVVELARHLDGRLGGLGAARRQLADRIAPGGRIASSRRSTAGWDIGRVERGRNASLPACFARRPPSRVAVPEAHHEDAEPCRRCTSGRPRPGRGCRRPRSGSAGPR